jgi:hypothetical protein
MVMYSLVVPAFHYATDYSYSSFDLFLIAYNSSNYTSHQSNSSSYSNNSQHQYIQQHHRSPHPNNFDLFLRLLMVFSRAVTVQKIQFKPIKKTFFYY